MVVEDGADVFGKEVLSLLGRAAGKALRRHDLAYPVPDGGELGIALDPLKEVVGLSLLLHELRRRLRVLAKPLVELLAVTTGGHGGHQDGFGGHEGQLGIELAADRLGVDDELLDRGRALDKLYVPTRYPNGLPAGAPADCFTRAEAEDAIRHAEVALAFGRRIVSR